jgi:hypothetical protein
MNSLKLVDNNQKDIKARAIKIRHDLIDEAIGLSKGDGQDTIIYHTMYSIDDYEIRLGKPGKEVFENNLRRKDGSRGNNGNDMAPTIFCHGTIIEKPGTFEEIFIKFLDYYGDEQSLQILGSLLFRCAYLLDHKENPQGHWRFYPPIDVIATVTNTGKFTSPEPLMVFLHYLEIIALNEDVKYHTLGYDIKTGIGRPNNLLTYAHIIALLIQSDGDIKNLAKSLLKFAGGLTRPPTGINAISFKKALEVFRLL